MQKNPIIDFLKESGCRLSAGRLAMVEIFTENMGTLSANEVGALLKEKKLSFDRSTIYRELDFLVEKNVLRVVDINGVRRFERSVPHPHFICSDCHEVICISSSEIESKISSLKKTIVSEHGEISINSLQISGLCSHCRKESACVA